MKHRGALIEVSELALVSPAGTRVWISELAAKALMEYSDTQQPPKFFLKKLKRYMQEGFGSFTSAHGPIKREWDGVYRIGDGSSLFRLVGFYGSGESEFIVIDAFTKSGQKLTESERERIDRAAEVRTRNLWVKVGEKSG